MYQLPVLIVDSGNPPLSSTNMLSVRVCNCDRDHVPRACGAVAYSLPAGLSTGALLAILGCILILLGKTVALISFVSVCSVLLAEINNLPCSYRYTPDA